MNASDADDLNLGENHEVQIQLNGSVETLSIGILESVPPGIALVPRSVGVPLQTPIHVELKPVK